MTLVNYIPDHNAKPYVRCLGCYGELINTGTCCSLEYTFHWLARPKPFAHVTVADIRAFPHFYNHGWRRSDYPLYYPDPFKDAARWGEGKDWERGGSES